MEYALILSGQGSERPGMLKDAIAEYEFAHDLVAEAQKYTGLDLFDIIKSNDLKKIADPRVNQFIIFLFHNIYSRLVIEKLGQKPEFVAGHSVGQLCSYAVSGAVSVEDMLAFLKDRTDIINDSSIDLKASFYNCFGITYDDMNSIISEHGLQEEIEIGLHNQETNVVVAVTEKGREKLEELKETYKFLVKKLDVARPYHTHFMNEYNSKLLPVIQKMNFKNPDFPILLNNGCKLEYNGDVIKAETEIQMIKPVFWYKSLNAVQCDNYIVLDPSKSQAKILSKIVKKNIVTVYNNSCLRNMKIQ